MYTGHLPGNAPPTPAEEDKYCSSSPLRSHGREGTLLSFPHLPLAISLTSSPLLPLHPSFHYHRRHLHITSEMWLASNCWLAHSPLSFLSLSNYSHLNNPLAAARRKKWGFLHRPPLALHSFPCFFLLSHFSFKNSRQGEEGGCKEDWGGGVDVNVGVYFRGGVSS